MYLTFRVNCRNNGGYRSNQLSETIGRRTCVWRPSDRVLQNVDHMYTCKNLPWFIFFEMTDTNTKPNSRLLEVSARACAKRCPYYARIILHYMIQHNSKGTALKKMASTVGSNLKPKGTNGRRYFNKAATLGSLRMFILLERINYYNQDKPYRRT